MLVLAEGFSLGLATGIFCLGACAPLVVPYVMLESKPAWATNCALVGQFLLGRLIAYILFAIAASLLGSVASGFLPSWVEPSTLFLAGCLMLFYAFRSYRSFPGLCKVVSKKFPAARMPLMLGFLVGINICPPFVAGMTRVFELHSVALSVAYFVAFFFGTSLYMLPLVIVTPIAHIQRLKSIGWLACFLAGAWFCISGILGLIP